MMSALQSKMVLKKNILALDIGDKRIGVALFSYEDQGVTPLRSYPKAQGKAEKALLDLLKKNKIDQIVVGYPLSADGVKTEQCLRVDAFVRRLEKRISIPIHLVDEYLSSEEAKHRLKIKGSPSKEVREKGIIDAVSASIILESYLQSLRG